MGQIWTVEDPIYSCNNQNSTVSLCICSGLMSMAYLLLCYCIIMIGCCIQVLNQYHCSVERLNTRKKDYQYVYNVFKQNNPSTTRFVTNDTLFHPLTYVLKQNMEWNHHSVCTNDTFALLMFFTYRDDSERRDMIREYIKQGMIVDGMTLNYVMVIACDVSEVDEMEQLRKENNQYGDLLVSMHKDDCALWPITVLDSFLWTRDYCSQAKYVIKVDGDVWVHLGNMVHYLRSAPKTGFYGGMTVHHWFRGGQEYKGVRFIPLDFQEKQLSFNLGAFTAFSNDVIPFVGIGTQFVDILFPACEDVLIGQILRKAGILPHRKPRDYVWMAFSNKLNNLTVSPNIISVHVKGFNNLKKLYVKYASNLTLSIRFLFLTGDGSCRS